ncbi:MULTISPECIES: FAD-binding oxidoreductase [Pseudomonas]|uniref:D-lactate dehydrogenase (cytochrome) n=3 Tax=Pseudomonas TaxID=286 RepID=A0A7Y1FD91_PSEVE|nr:MULTISPECIES: FAD-linked oxidase C-terminal domain-containing protein [Pseudomonas]MBH1968599.1 FAD-binding protein [Pseudomonadales bacterium]KHK61778.1 lactate dehydrogenase [Pseudomonas frederiksbergensis]MBH2031241.1 FAD-binding protein [Pseudomonadales bacterium]MBH2075467.1 FAD-binding protein [Pseudomonadales bacterium]MBI6551627.1 FAD-binding protein [Pseudomonas veronii]
MSTHHALQTSPMPTLLDALRELLGERLSTSRTECEQHGRGESYHQTLPPDAVCYAESTAEVATIVKLCAAQRVPIIAFGAGTSLEGHVGAAIGGVCIDLSRMQRIIDVRPDDLDVTVEAGVTRMQLNAELRTTGLFFPVDPGGESTLGGMAATRASGTNAVRYGTMRENVLNLTVVLADGQVIKTGGRARKSAAGYDLTRLFVGSEGTLGIITEVTLRLYGIPETTCVAVCTFPTIASAVSSVVSIIQYGIPASRVELLDARTVQAVNRFSQMRLTETPTLFFEFAGSPASVAEQVELTQEIVESNGALGFQTAADADARSALWRARHNVHYAMQSMRPNARIWSTDVCVPISALTQCIAETAEDVAKVSFFVGVVGHVGDGNFHLGLVVDPDNEAEMAEAEALNERVVERAIALDGTCTGEHGIGSGKIKYMALEHGAAVGVMRLIKQALDPLGLMNPGKILPEA